MADTLFEIQQTLHEVSEQNLKLAHATCDQFITFVTRAMGAWMEAMPSYPAAADVKEVQDRAAHFAKDNANSAFTFAGKISAAPISPETLTLQMQFAQDWMQVFTAQTQEIYGLIQEVLQKVELGALDVRASAAAADPMAAGFKDIKVCAVEMAKVNAESAFVLVEKIGNGQNIQDVLALQAQFARKQMETYVAQAQGLRRLIYQLQQAKSPTSAAA